MAEIEEVLWNIFTSYSLNGNPRDPSRMNGSGLLKLCRDIRALDPIMTETPLTQAYLDLIYTSEIKSPKKIRSSQADKSDKLDFDQFLSCLIRIALKCYPSGKTKDESMQQLLMDNILPNAARRRPVNISSFLKQPTVEGIFKYYENALAELFKFYAASSDQTLKGKNLIRATSNVVKTFDDQKGLIEEAKTRSHIQNSSINCIGYSDFMRFANDFAMTTSLGLTSLDLGDIYLTVISSNNFSPTLRKITFQEFWEALVRSALVAFKDNTKITTENKIKGLFHYIWRNTQTTTQDHMISYGTLGGGGFNTYRGGLLKGAALLNDKFIVAWTKDDYRDYLQLDDKKQQQRPGSSGGPKTADAALSTKAKGGATGNSSSLMNKLLSKGTGETSSGKARSSSNKAGSIKKSSSASSSNVFASLNEEQDEHNRLKDEEEALHTLLLETTELQETFVVQTEAGDSITVKIRDDDQLGDIDGRFNVADLRRLLSVRPDIANILYESILEEGIIQPPPSSSARGVDIQSDEEGGAENSFSTPAKGSPARKSSRGQSLSVADLSGEGEDEDEAKQSAEVSAAEGGDQQDELDAMMDGLVDDHEEPEDGDDGDDN